MRVGLYDGIQRSQLIVTGVSIKYEVVCVNCKKDTGFQYGDLVDALESQLRCGKCGGYIHTMVILQPYGIYPKRLDGYLVHGDKRIPVFRQKRGKYDVFMDWHCRNPACYYHHWLGSTNLILTEGDTNVHV